MSAKVRKKTKNEETFGKNEYKSYVMLDFSKATDNIRKIFVTAQNHY